MAAQVPGLALPGLVARHGMCPWTTEFVGLKGLGSSPSPSSAVVDSNASKRIGPMERDYAVTVRAMSSLVTEPPEFVARMVNV